jgi:hypothetical protein
MWIRRATLDLTGLPPSSETVRRFFADGSPEASERRVDAGRDFRLTDVSGDVAYPIIG